MHSDPIVDEVRRIRQAYAQQYAFDLCAIADDLRLRELQHTDRLITYPAKPVRARKQV